MTLSTETLRPDSQSAGRRLGPSYLVASKAGSAALLAVTAQHMAPAVGDYFAAKTLLTLAKNEPVGLSPVGWVLAQSAFHAVGPLSGFAKANWRVAATRHYEMAAIDVHQSRPALWLTQRSTQEHATHKIVNDVPWVVNMLLGLLEDGAALGATLVTQALVLATLLGPSVLADLALCCLVGAAAGVVAAKIDQARLRVTQHPLGDPHTRYGAWRERMWDNTLLGNVANFSRWSAGYGHAKRAYHSQRLIQASTATGVASVAQLAATTMFGLRMAFRAEALWRDHKTEQLVAFFLPAMARSMRLLTKAGDLGPWITQWSKHIRILKRLQGEMLEPCKLNPSRLVERNLALNPRSLQVVDAANRQLPPLTLVSHPPASGRFTLRGLNGAGKSMLAMAVKIEHPETVYYLPAHHDLMFNDLTAGSSGETAQRTLAAAMADIERDGRITTLIADEWDATLHVNAMNKVSPMLDAFSNRVGVIDITHRHRE